MFVDFSTDRDGGDVIVTTIDDVIAFEDDTIVLRHVTTTGIKEGLEQFGEFLRDFTTVTIIDNEGKYTFMVAMNCQHIVWCGFHSFRIKLFI